MASSASDAALRQRVGELSRTPATICEFQWSIPDFLSLSVEGGQYYFSPLISLGGASCVLGMLPNGDADSIGYIGLALLRKQCIRPIILQVTFSFKTSDGKEDRGRYQAKDISDDDAEIYLANRCLLRTEILERKAELLPSNILTVFCTVKHSKCTKDAGEGCSLGSFINPRENKVLYDLKEFFLKKENCDVVLKAQGQKFPAHKTILEARSPVLASTFRNDMKEKATGVVDIVDCDPSSFSDFLCFLYCGDTEVITPENVFSLFTAADKYDVEDLRAQCVKIMKQNLSVDIFCDTIILALRHSEAELIKYCTDFFVENAKDITVTVKWQMFLAENPTESNELIVKFFASSISSK